MEIGNRPAKILILGEASAIHTRRWVNYFRAQGWTVRWLSFPPIPENVTAEPIPLRFPQKAAAIALSVRRVRRIIDQFTPDIISALFLPDYGWLAGLCNRRPLAVSAWGSDVLISPLKSRWHKRRIEYVLRKADALFADAELLGERMRELGANDAKIHIVPLGVDAVWLEDSGTRRASNDAPIRVITNRRMEPLYRVDTFIRAASRLVTGIPGQYEFIIAGDGSQRMELERLTSELGLETAIRFAGAVSDDQMRHLLHQSDLFVSCSRSDGTSVSMLEAMASGCVPIVTDLAVNHEWIRPGENGLMFPVDDSEALANAISYAAGDAEWREGIRVRNREIITSRALWNDNMAAVEAVLAKTINAYLQQDAAGERP
jgi:glycosyltransferase involved in cell wall biosynthesis